MKQGFKACVCAVVLCAELFAAGALSAYAAQGQPLPDSGMTLDTAELTLDIKVAVMGCVVNGPGEAKEADIGIAGGIGEGLLIKKGEVVKKVKEDELLETLRQELLHWNE